MPLSSKDILFWFYKNTLYKKKPLKGLKFSIHIRPAIHINRFPCYKVRHM